MWQVEGDGQSFNINFNITKVGNKVVCSQYRPSQAGSASGRSYPPATSLTHPF